MSALSLEQLALVVTNLNSAVARLTDRVRFLEHQAVKVAQLEGRQSMLEQWAQAVRQQQIDAANAEEERLFQAAKKTQEPQ